MGEGGEPNALLRRAREAMPSPNGARRPMSRRELAHAMSTYLAQVHGMRVTLDENYIGRFERGEYRFPNAKYREALRHILQRTDAELGFYVRRNYGEAPTSLGQGLAGASLMLCDPVDNGHWPEVVGALRQALHDYRDLCPALTPEPQNAPWSQVALQRAIAGAWSLYQNSMYGALAQRLPGLIGHCLDAERAYGGDLGQRASVLTAQAHHVTAVLLTKLGNADLAWLAASRALAAANRSGDIVAIGSASRAAAHALAAGGLHGQARRLGTAAAEYLSPALSKPTPELLSVYGSLHLMCALSAARDSDERSAKTHLEEAADAATRLGQDANHAWTAFGPANVKIHGVCVGLELDDLQAAIDADAGIELTRMPVERQVRHAIEMARVQFRRNCAEDALAQLLSAERLAPEQVRYHALSRQLIQRMISRPVVSSHAMALAHRMALPASA